MPFIHGAVYSIRPVSALAIAALLVSGCKQPETHQFDDGEYAGEILYAGEGVVDVRVRAGVGSPGEHLWVVTDNPYVGTLDPSSAGIDLFFDLDSIWEAEPDGQWHSWRTSYTCVRKEDYQAEVRLQVIAEDHEELSEALTLDTATVHCAADEEPWNTFLTPTEPKDDLGSCTFEDEDPPSTPEPVSGAPSFDVWLSRFNGCTVMHPSYNQANGGYQLNAVTDVGQSTESKRVFPRSDKAGLDAKNNAIIMDYLDYAASLHPATDDGPCETGILLHYTMYDAIMTTFEDTVSAFVSMANDSGPNTLELLTFEGSPQCGDTTANVTRTPMAVSTQLGWWMLDAVPGRALLSANELVDEDSIVDVTMTRDPGGWDFSALGFCGSSSKVIGVTYAAFDEDDTNGYRDLYILDLDPDDDGVEEDMYGWEYTRVTPDTFSTSSTSFRSADCSEDGSFVTFAASGTLSGAFVVDLVTGDLEVVSTDADGRDAGAQCNRAQISPSGKSVSFECDAQTMDASSGQGNEVYIVSNPMF